MPKLNVEVLLKILKKHTEELYLIYVDAVNVEISESILNQITKITNLINQIEDNL